MDHRQHKCHKDWCSVCRNQQKVCTVCGAWDKEQAAHCPGYQLPQVKKDLIYYGDLDFKDGKWVDGLV